MEYYWFDYEKICRYKLQTYYLLLFICRYSYRFIKCIHTRANETLLPIRKETRASSEAMKQKKRSVCCNILMKFIKFTELLSPKFGASKRKVYDILLKFNHPKVNLKVSYTMKVSSNNEVFMLLQNFRFPVSFCPSTRNKSEWGGK